MYAIAFDFNNTLNEKQHLCVKNTLEANGFEYRFGIYFGWSKDLNQVQSILIIMDLINDYEWFSKKIKAIKMFRIEEEVDMMRLITKNNKS